MKKEVKSAKCPMCGSDSYETLAIEDINKDDFDNELTLIEVVVCCDCQNQFDIKVRYKLEELESEVMD